MDDVSMPSSDKIAEMCDMISRQTDYTLDEIKDKLIEYNYNSIEVIKEYMGVQKEKPRPITSINQEIYKQIRMTLDEGIKDFNEKQYKKGVEDLTSDDKQD